MGVTTAGFAALLPPYAGYYDPESGQFLSTDPVLPDGNTGASFNRYAYASDNPYRFVDPDGRESQQRMQDETSSACTGSHIAGVGCGAPALSINVIDSAYRRGADTPSSTSSGGRGNAAGSASTNEIQSDVRTIKLGEGTQMAGGALLIGAAGMKVAGALAGVGVDALGAGPEDVPADYLGLELYGGLSRFATTALARPGTSMLNIGTSMVAVGAIDLMARGHPRTAANAVLEGYGDAFMNRFLPPGVTPFVDNKILDPVLNRAEDAVGAPSDK